MTKNNWLSISQYAARFGKRNTPALRATLSRLCRTGRFAGNASIDKDGHYIILSTAQLPPPLRRGRKVKEKSK